MREVLPRRAVLGRLAALPFLGAATFGPTFASAATSEILQKIDDVERRCHETKVALERALAAFEASVPQPHFTLLDQSGAAITFENERRLFDGHIVSRGLDRRGDPCRRSIATIETLTRDLDAIDPDAYGVYSKTVRRIRRRAARHEARVQAAEDAFQLKSLWHAEDDADREMQDLAKAVFERPAGTLAEVRVQARMLRAYASTAGKVWREVQAGRYGATLAANLDMMDLAA